MSRIPELIDGCVAAFGALPGLSDAIVADGPLVSGSADPLWVLVGFDGNGDGDFIAATSEADVSGMGMSNEEEINLTVSLVALRGDTDVKAARDAVYDLYRAVAGYLRANPGGPLPGAEVLPRAYSLSQLQTPDGCQARIALTLRARTFTL